MPAAEAAFHPAADNGRRELNLMCEDLASETARLEKKGVACPAPHRERWGAGTKIPFPGGGAVGLYRPSHPIALGANHCERLHRRTFEVPYPPESIHFKSPGQVRLGVVFKARRICHQSAKKGCHKTADLYRQRSSERRNIHV